MCQTVIIKENQIRTLLYITTERRRAVNFASNFRNLLSVWSKNINETKSRLCLRGISPTKIFSDYQELLFPLSGNTSRSLTHEAMLQM